ncbi:parB-like partition protein [Clostridium sp. CAG:1219]|nr:parB-like partition protein [Clostridium sp. CAG:1219]
MAKTQKGLGRGLNAFFGEDTEKIKSELTEEKVELGNVVELKISDVEPMEGQPRKIFDKEKLQELSDSIKEQGVIQPILVVKSKNGYMIVAGERRWRAAKLAGLKTIPAIVKDYSDTKKKQVALIENIQREDLNVIEVARAIKELMEEDGYTTTEVAKLTGKNISTVSNTVRLLKLQDKIIDYVLEGKLSEGHARALLALDSKTRQLQIADKIIEKKLSVRDAEKLVYGSEEYIRKPEKKEPNSVYYKKIEEKLKGFFGYNVKLNNNSKNGKLVIEYNDEEGLDSILNKLKIKM